MNILRFEKLDSIKRLVLQIFALFVLTSTQATAHGAGIRFVPLQVPESGVSESDASKLSALSEALDVMTASEDVESIFDAWQYGAGPRWKKFRDFLRANNFTARDGDVGAIKAFESYHKRKTNRLSNALFGGVDADRRNSRFQTICVGKRAPDETYFALLGARGWVFLDVKEREDAPSDGEPLYIVRSAEIVVCNDPLVQTWRFNDFGAPVRFEERRLASAPDAFSAYSPDVVNFSASTLERAVVWDSDGVATQTTEPFDASSLVAPTPPFHSSPIQFSQGSALVDVVAPLRRLLELIHKDATPSRALLEQLNDGTYSFFNVLSEDASHSYVAVSYYKDGAFVSVALTNEYGTLRLEYPTTERGVRVVLSVYGSKERTEYVFDADGKLTEALVIKRDDSLESREAFKNEDVGAADPDRLQKLLQSQSVVRSVEFNDDGSVKSDQSFLPGEKRPKIRVEVL